jgi:hypothetical protein
MEKVQELKNSNTAPSSKTRRDELVLCCLGIPALVPVVEDVFLIRGSSSTSSFDMKELDTQREVLVSMLLRLVEYHQVSLFDVPTPHHSCNFTNIKLSLSFVMNVNDTGFGTTECGT